MALILTVILVALVFAPKHGLLAAKRQRQAAVDGDGRDEGDDPRPAPRAKGTPVVS